MLKNRKTNETQELNIIADNLIEAFRQSKGVAQYILRWDIKDVELLLLTPKQYHIDQHSIMTNLGDYMIGENSL